MSQEKITIKYGKFKDVCVCVCVCVKYIYFEFLMKVMKKF